MICPKCKIGLMADSKRKRNKFDLRCMKCGKSFFVDAGVLKQRKNAKVIKTKNGVTITRHDVGDSSKSDSIKQAEQTQFILNQAKEVQRLNQIARSNKRH